MTQESITTNDYAAFIADLKADIARSRVKAALAVNRELVLLYWRIGNGILAKQDELGWGAKVVEQISVDLRLEFPETKGLSSRNLKYMRSFADNYPDYEFVQQAAAQIPWFHNRVILDKVKEPSDREFYIRKTIENGWSRNILEIQIESGLHLRQDKTVAEYALRDMSKPIGISRYDSNRALPENLRGSLPTIDEIEMELRMVTETAK